MGGVGIWTADALDTLTYPEDGVEMWGALLGPPPPQDVELVWTLGAMLAKSAELANASASGGGR